MKLDLSDYTLAPYAITSDKSSENKTSLLSEKLRGTTIGSQWKTPTIDTLTNLKERTPTAVEDFGWSLGASTIDAIRNIVPALAIEAITNPGEFVAGTATAGVGMSAGAQLSSYATSKFWKKALGSLGAIGGGATAAIVAGAASEIRAAGDAEDTGWSSPAFQKRMMRELDEAYAKGDILETEYQETKNAYARFIRQTNEIFEKAAINKDEKNEVVNLLEGREYPDGNVVDSILSWSAKTIKDRADLREWQIEQRKMNPNGAANTAGVILGNMVPLYASSYLYRNALLRPRYRTIKGVYSATTGAEKVVKEPLKLSRAQLAEKVENLGKAYTFAQMAGQYETQNILDYIEKTGDVNLANYKPTDMQGFMAGGYAAISTLTEYELGGIQPLIAGSFKKVGIKMPTFKAGLKTAGQELTEEEFQNLEEFLARNIDDTNKMTWGEFMETAAKSALWAGIMGGTVGTLTFRTNRNNLVKGIMAYGKGQITQPQAVQIANAMIETMESTVDYRKNELRDSLRQKVALMYESADIENKADTIDAITDLEYSLIAADSAERGIDIAENPLFKGEVNALGWFREGIPEARRAEIEGHVKELADLKDQLKTLNKAKEKDWAKIDEIENKLNKFNSYVLEKLSDIARADGRQVAKILDDMEGTFVQKEKEKRFIVPTPEERIEIDNKTTAIQEDLRKDGFEVNKKQYVNYTSGDGATYLFVSGKGQAPLVVRIGVSPIGRYHRRVNANFSANMSTEEILTALRNMIDSGNIPNNRKGQNVNIGFATRPSAEPVMQNRVSGGAPATYRGAYIPEYRFILRANRMDASTLSHELAHDWFETNFARYRSGEATPDFMRAWGALEKALGVEEGAKVAPRKASEIFARAYEGWVMNKTDWEKAINVDDKDKDDIVKLMQDYQNNLRDIYQDLTNPYFKQTWGKLGELKPELVKWFDRMTNIRDLDRLVERGEMSEAEANQEKLNRAIDVVIENTIDPESKQRLEYARTLNDTQRYEVEGGNKNALQRRLGALAQAIDENNMLIKENYDTRRDMLEVAKQADNFVRTRLDDALAIINGQMAEQEGLFKEDIYTALERLALEEGDLGLLDELKNSEIANRLAKELGQRVAGFRNWSGGEMDIVSSLKALDNRFNKALQNKKAKAQLQEVEQMFAKAQAEQDKLADKQLEATLKELECK